MADRTVRAVFEARVDKAKRNISSFGDSVADAGKKTDDLSKDLKDLDGRSADPEIDVQIDDAKKQLKDLTGELADLKSMEASPEVDLEIERVQGQIKDVRSEIKSLTSQKAEVRVDVAIKDAEKRLSEVKQELGELRTLDTSPEVDVQIKEARRRLRDVKGEIRDLNSAKADMKVTADTSAASSALDGLADEAADAGAEGGDDAGSNMVEGILGALVAIPIAGAVIGVGAAIGEGILQGIQEGLAIEAGRDLFSARTGLDEGTSAKFGRAAGEAYSKAWGDSVADNMETARVALEQGLLDEDAVQSEVEKVIASLSGVTEIMQADIPDAARAAGQLIRSGLVDNSQEAFDVLVAGYQNGADASHDFLDTLEEYPTHFRDLGLSAEEATGLLIQGMEAGAFNSDKVADALKELTIRVKENSDESSAALQQLGLSGTEMAEAFAKGGPKAHDALEQILDGLRGVKDPAERSRLAVALFGTQAEDMAQALGALDLSSAAQEIGGVKGAAGAAERALRTMKDNASADIEQAQRNIEVAMDGIKGALAASFGDEISAVAEWVQENREPLMQFFLDAINGALDAGIAFAEFGAQVLDTLAQMMEGLAGLENLPGIGKEFGDAMRQGAEGAREAADTLRTDVPNALNTVRDKANNWAAPAIMQARVHDAKVAMANDMDAFSAKVDASGGTVKINGNKVNAEQALKILQSNINKSDGTVTINGNRVPANKALATVLEHINGTAGLITINGNPVPANKALSHVRNNIDTSSGTVTINGNRVPAGRALSTVKGIINSSKGTVSIGGDTGPAQRSTDWLVRAVNGRQSSIGVGADTWNAERDINHAARDRTSTITVNRVIRTMGGWFSDGSHEGGWIAEGRNSGGYVPGINPGYDNVLWPLNSGGQTLTQPLTGGEYVVNAGSAAVWGPVLEWMNSGGRPSASTAAAAYNGPTARDMEAAMTRAVSGLQVVTRIGDRDFHGVLKRVEAGRSGR